ncbi:MAG: symmetrical bis(5'-nucleosyl)-tetraphosphatase [Betaproteobacteria bacterium]|nr:symmetrical bis(5'-nucleosyl)-tetraphosphatase [Betaproteobacteria bacterium]
MSVYVIGDLQGCLEPLERLLRHLPLKRQDRLWFVGDVVNRGPHSLETLCLVRSLGERATVVLGNHDLHLLCVAAGATHSRPGDTLSPILESADRKELLEWVRGWPLLHQEQGVTMVHAGLLPQWTVSQAGQLAGEVSALFRSDLYHDFLPVMYGNIPSHWENSLSGIARWRTIINGMTRLRICSADGAMEFGYKGSLRNIPDGFMPWFAVPQRRSAGEFLVCGHWSALGLHQGGDIQGLDSGCLWGGPLTALRLEDRVLFQVEGMPSRR